MKRSKRRVTRASIRAAAKRRIIKSLGSISFPKHRIDAKRLKRKAYTKLRIFQRELAAKRTKARKEGLQLFTADFLEALRERLRETHGEADVPKASVQGLAGFLPYFDWRLAGIVPPIRNQDSSRRQCSACWAYTATEAFESRLNYNLNRFKVSIVGRKRIPMTHVSICIQNVLDCVAGGRCDAGWHGDVFNHFVNLGAIVRELNTFRINNRRDAIGKSGRCKTSRRMTTRAVAWCFVNDEPDKIPSVKSLKKALLEHGPLLVLVTPDEEFSEYRGGLFPRSRTRTKDNPFPNHTVLLTGWDDKKKAWIIQNQFGEHWGTSCITRQSIQIRPVMAKRLKRHGGCMYIRWGCNDVGKFASWIEAPLDARLPKT